MVMATKPVRFMNPVKPLAHKATAKAPAKRGPKPKPKLTAPQKVAATLADNTGSAFCTRIASKADSERTSKIRGHSL